MLKGDLVNWTTAKFDIVNMTSETHSISDICIPARPGHVILPEKRTFANHQDMCSKFKGIPSVVSDKETQNQMNKIIKPHAVCKGIKNATRTFVQRYKKNRIEPTVEISQIYGKHAHMYNKTFVLRMPIYTETNINYWNLISFNIIDTFH